MAASYFSTLLTSTTTHITTLKQTLLSHDTDGDTEDDTHLCRVLRAYHIEKGRPFPAWLPPDPKAPPPPVVVQPVYAQSQVGRGYGGLNSGQQGGSQGGGGGQQGGSALSSLWDAPQGGAGAGQQAQENSLRTSGRAGRQGASGSGSGSGGPAPQRQSPFTRQQSPQQQVQARPLPSQRAGSVQSGGWASDTSTAGGSGGMSAQDRLKKKFNRVAGSERDGGGGGGSFDTGRSSGRETSGGSGADRPFMAATSPWATNEMEFGGGGYTAGGGAPQGGSSGGGGGGARQGLPSGPGASRRGPGLPSGPRGVR